MVLAPTYAEQPSYQLLVRVFNEHFILNGKNNDGLVCCYRTRFPLSA